MPASTSVVASGCGSPHGALDAGAVFLGHGGDDVDGLIRAELIAETASL